MDNEILDLEEIPSIDRYAGLHNIKKEERLNLMNRITHMLALVVILFFLFLLIIQVFIFQDKQVIPNYFISIVSIIIGFYFAKSPLFE